MAVLNVSHVTHQHKRTMPYLNNTTPLSLPNIPYWHLPRDNTALGAVWCQLSAQTSALGEPKELGLSKGYDKILLSIPPGVLPPTAQPQLRKSSNTSEKCLHATYTLLPCISGGDPGCPVNSPCKQTPTESAPWGWGQPQWGWGFMPLPKIQSVSPRIALSASC